MTSQHLEPALRVAMIGIGARAGLGRHVAAAGGAVVAAVDLDPTTAGLARELYGDDVDLHPSVESLLAAHPDLDAAIVASPDDTHHAVTTALLEAGVAAYVEKPLAITIEDADDLLETAFRTGSRLYVGHNMRHMPVVRLMRDIIARGEIGEVRAVWCRHFVGTGGDFYFKDWHADRSRSTSLLLQKGAHDLDVIHWLAGAPTLEVVAMGDLMVYDKVSSRRDNSDQRMWDWYSSDTWPPLSQTNLNPVIDVEDISMMTMRLANGVLASYQQCHFTPDYWRNYTVIGTAGRLENVGDGPGGEVRVWNQRGDFVERGHTQYPLDGSDEGHGGADPLTVGEFLRFVREGGPTDTSPVAARDAVAAGVAATASLRGGSLPQTVLPVRVELADYFERHQAAERSRA